MEILITNDDGYKAKGVHTLARIMSAFGQVTVIAPKHHQSAMSMAVSLGLKKLAWKALPDEKPGEWSYLDATPASCIKFAMNYKFCSRRPDIVVTGINHGTNATTAANYSATLGAAEEAALCGCRAIGVSLGDFRPDADFSAIEALFPKIFRMLTEDWPEDAYGLLYNVNFPALPLSEIRGIRFTRQGKGHWIKEFQEWDEELLKRYDLNDEFYWQAVDRPLEPGEKGYMMIGTFVDDEPATQDTDADHRLLEQGYVTITPNNLDPTDYAELARRQQRQQGCGTI